MKSYACFQNAYHMAACGKHVKTFLLLHALFLGARMLVSVTEGRWNRSRLTCHVKEKMNEVEEGNAKTIQSKGAAQKYKNHPLASIWVKSQGMIYSRLGVTPPTPSFFFFAPPASWKGVRNWRLLRRRWLYLALVTEDTVV